MKKKAAKKSPARQTIRGKGWKRPTTVPQEKFDVISRAILRILSKREQTRWGDICDGVAAQVPRFEGAIHWYTTSCLRELESQGKVVRHRGPPVKYSRK